MIWYELSFVGFLIAFFSLLLGVKIGIRVEGDRWRQKKAVHEGVEKYVRDQKEE